MEEGKRREEKDRMSVYLYGTSPGAIEWEDVYHVSIEP
jgi:hypothetical protein